MDEQARPTPRSPVYINRNFALLWSGQAISFAGDMVFETVLVIWIATRLAHGYSWAPLAVSGALLAAAVPMALIGPFSGVFVDRWEKRPTMLWMDALRACLILSLLLTTGVTALPLLGTPAPAVKLGSIYAVVFLATVCSQFFGPSRLALIKDVVPPEQQGRASGMAQATIALASIVGPMIAAPLYFGFGPSWALGLDAASFVASFLLVMAVRPPAGAQSDRDGEQGDVLRELRDGLRFYRRSRMLMVLLVASSLGMLGAGCINTLDIFFVTQNLHTSASLYGVLSGAFGLGALIGAIVCSVTVDRIGATRIFTAGLLAAAVGLFVYSRLHAFLPAAILLFVLGIPVAGINVAVQPLLLLATPRELIGRVSAVLMPATSLAGILSMVLSGWLDGTVLHGFHASFLDMRFGPVDTIFGAGAALMVVGALYALVALRDSAVQAHGQPDDGLEGPYSVSA